MSTVNRRWGRLVGAGGGLDGGRSMWATGGTAVSNSTSTHCPENGGSGVLAKTRGVFEIELRLRYPVRVWKVREGLPSPSHG